MTQVPSPAKPHATRTTASVQGREQSYRPSSATPCCPLWALSCTGAGGCWSLPRGRVMGQPPQSLDQQPAPLQVPCLPQPPWGDVLWGNGPMECSQKVLPGSHLWEEPCSSPLQVTPSLPPSLLSFASEQIDPHFEKVWVLKFPLLSGRQRRVTRLTT